MRRLLIGLTALLVADGAMAQDIGCQAEWARANALLSNVGYLTEPLVATPEATDDGGCRIDRLTIPAGAHLTIKTEALDWSGDERARFATDGLPPFSLDLTLSGIRVVPDIGDPAMTYLMEIQNAARRADLGVRAVWDEEADRLDLEEISLSFASGDYVRYSASIDGVDISTLNNLQMSAGSFAITETRLEIRSHGLFEDYALLPIGLALLHGEPDPAARIEELKAQARAEIARLPSDVFPRATQTALSALVSDMPSPAGTLTIRMTAKPGLGAARMMPLANSRSGVDRLDDIWALMDGVRYDATYDRQ